MQFKAISLVRDLSNLVLPNLSLPHLFPFSTPLIISIPRWGCQSPCLLTPDIRERLGLLCGIYKKKHSKSINLSKVMND